MRQDQRGAAGHQPIQRLLDDRLVLRIDRGQRLVQHQDRRVAQQRAGDGDALALAAGQARAALADHRLVAVRQRLDEVVRIGGAGGGDEVGLAGIGAAEAQVLLDRAVEQIGVLRHHRDQPAHRFRIERAQVLAADADRAALRIVQPQQQADDGGFAGAAGADDADALAGGDVEGEAPMRRAPAAGIGEVDRFECDAPFPTLPRFAGEGAMNSLSREAGESWGGGARRGDRRVQQRVDAGRRRLAGQALVQHGAQLAQRAEDFRAGHQHDQQRLEAHLAMADAIRAQHQRRGRAERAAEIGDAARQNAGAEHQERAVRQCARLVGQHPAVAAALAERLQRRQTLHRVEEFLAERLERILPHPRRAAGALVHHRGRHQGEQRGAQHHGGDRNVPERDEGEDRHRRAGRDRHLRQVLAEERLQLLDAVDDRQHDAAGAFGAEPRRPERDDLVVQAAAQRLLHARRGAVRDHGAHVVEPGAQQDGGQGADQRDDQLGGRRAAEQPGEELAEEGEPGDADRQRQQAEQNRQCDASAQTARHAPQSQVEMHGSLSRDAPPSWAFRPVLRKREIFNRC